MLTLAFIVFIILMVAGLRCGFFDAGRGPHRAPAKDRPGNSVVVVPLTMHNSVDVIALIAVPLFILAGEFMNQGGVTRRLIEWSMAMVGLSATKPFPGLGCHQLHHGRYQRFGQLRIGFSAIGAAMLPSMEQGRLSVKGTGAGRSLQPCMLGPIIPPSIPMIDTRSSRTPPSSVCSCPFGHSGILLTIGYMILCWIYAKRRWLSAWARSSWRERATVNASRSGPESCRSSSSWASARGFSPTRRLPRSSPCTHS